MIMSFFNKKKTSDESKLITLMRNAVDGKFVLCEEENFNNKKLARVYNDLIRKFMQSSNQTVMSLNESMETIGNCDNVRNMLRIVERQKDNLNSVSDSGESLSKSVSESEEVLNGIKQDVKSAFDTSVYSKSVMRDTILNVNKSYEAVIKADDAMNRFSEKSKEMKAVLDLIHSIARQTQILSMNANIEALRSIDGGGLAVIAGEIGKMSAGTQESVSKMDRFMSDIFKEISQLVRQLDDLKDMLDTSRNSASETERSVQNMAESMNNVIGQISELYNHINSQNTSTKSLTENIITIAEDSDNLYSRCKKPVMDMYTISRAIDKVRTKYIKGYSCLSQKELIDIYNTDHLIFTGRLYNMIEGFEELKLKNLNNPDKCKYGRWMRNLKKEHASLADAFGRANDYHTRLHELATSCFYAYKAGKKEQATQLFEQAHEVYRTFSSELNRLKNIIH